MMLQALRFQVWMALKHRALYYSLLISTEDKFTGWELIGGPNKSPILPFLSE
ncbi:hypothetical protein PAXRUDRAFT_662569 [Paxillus rubicundulus Ve08.2h10]|uniref:Unplaced genomic scaffold scaffold_6440, whole genome shotgun sequence n=1 Tax=Paxillus rubicundulus Ve08.2h10 TaxID=930991 RepID=A0A0D0D5F6_9AGAM|nr:hypothetical protein PAXRUDRAFT_662569 [Paxillus rubicundulus Ve08.2h10]